MASAAPAKAEQNGAKATAADENASKPEEPKKPPPPKTTPKYFIHSKRFLDVVVIIWGICALGAARYFRPGFWSTILYALVGLPIGLALSFMFYLRKKSKAKVRQLVRPGLLAQWPRRPHGTGAARSERSCGATLRESNRLAYETRYYVCPRLHLCGGSRACAAQCRVWAPATGSSTVASRGLTSRDLTLLCPRHQAVGTSKSLPSIKPRGCSRLATVSAAATSDRTPESGSASQSV